MSGSVRIVVRTVIVVVTVLLTLYLIYLLRRPIGWLVIAAFIAVALSGPVNLLNRHIRRGFAILIVYLGLLALTVILDPEDYLAAQYNLVASDGAVRWGQFILDRAAVVRQAQVCRCHVPPDAAELVRSARAIAACSSFDCIEDQSPFRHEE